MQEYIVETKYGRVRGYEREGLIEYLGIPYAKPPVGELRWKRAQRPEPWDDVFDAKDYGPEAVQYDENKVKGAEDCLKINVQRPLEGENLPVFVYIHGGGYNTGAASVPLYNGKHFAQDGLVFVSFQYRLNVLGFYDFSTYPGCEDFESNRGLSDQILAMQWIHENIAAFGGDPKRVTIDGESAGAASVLNMMSAPAVKGTFQQAIVQSGLPNCLSTKEMARKNVEIFLEGMGWTEADLPKLRTIDPYMLLAANQHVAEEHQYRNPGIFLPGPVIDDLLPMCPVDAIASGSADGIRLLIGTNLHEGTMFVHPEKTGFPNSWTMIAQMFENNGHADALARVLDYYHPSHNDRFMRFKAQEQFSMSSVPPMREDYKQEGAIPFIRFSTDYVFQAPSIQIALSQREYTKDVWVYRYEFVSKTGVETGWLASHAFELPASFANMDFEFSQFIFKDENEETKQSLIHDIHDAWVRFAKTGNPGEEWRRFEGTYGPTRIFDRVSRMEDLDYNPMLNVWKDLRFYDK